ncbi:MAG: hypothetical protein Alpg2KO_33790 [Alphaproteobacteria bacterium]
MSRSARFFRLQLKPWLLRGGLFALCLYFIGFALHGTRGLDELSLLQAERTDLDAELQQVLNKRVALGRRVAMLRAETLELDMLEEQMRRVLVVAHPADLVILHESADSSSDL